MTSYTISDVVADRRITEAVVKHAEAEAQVEHDHRIGRRLIAIGAALFLFTAAVVDKPPNPGCTPARSQSSTQTKDPA